LDTLIIKKKNKPLKRMKKKKEKEKEKENKNKPPPRSKELLETQ
jgi:hypothetical protein